MGELESKEKIYYVYRDGYSWSERPFTQDSGERGDCGGDFRRFQWSVFSGDVDSDSYHGGLVE
jgi:hypothetical protein